MRPIFVVLTVAGCLLLAACDNLPQSLPLQTQLPATNSAVSTPVAATVVGEAVPYEIVAEGDPMVGAGQDPFAVAWRPGGEVPAPPAGLPDEAQAALEQLRSQGGYLYLVIYGGVQPSSRYAVKIIAVTVRDGKLQVLYRVEGPPPGQGAATVMTHPYVIAKISSTTLQPADVTFVEEKIAR